MTNELLEYATLHSSSEPELLKQLRRETWQKVLNPIMLSGVYQGRLLSVLSRIKQPRQILELGTYTGYSTLCLAEGLQPQGKIITIDKNEELQGIQHKYFSQSNYAKSIQPILGNALEIIPKLNTTFDLVFIDAQKTEYQQYLKLIYPITNKGGLIIIDNVLWHSKVLEENPSDPNAKQIKKLNYFIKKEFRVNLIFPVRDGLNLIIKD